MEELIIKVLLFPFFFFFFFSGKKKKKKKGQNPKKSAHEMKAKRIHTAVMDMEVISKKKKTSDSIIIIRRLASEREIVDQGDLIPWKLFALQY